MQLVLQLDLRLMRRVATGAQNAIKVPLNIKVNDRKRQAAAEGSWHCRMGMLSHASL